MNKIRLLKGAVVATVCYLALHPLPGQPAETPASADRRPATIDLTREQLLDHIRGGWTGMLIGGIEGLAHEFKYIEQPRETLPDYPFLPNGARSDDDNDFEWTHLCFMDKEGVLKLPYPRIVEIWKANMNRGSLGRQPPGPQTHGPGRRPAGNRQPRQQLYAPYNLSGQFCVESYGMIAPGMPQTAADIGLHYARIAVSGEPLQATRYWTTLISLVAVSERPVGGPAARVVAGGGSGQRPGRSGAGGHQGISRSPRRLEGRPAGLPREVVCVQERAVES